MALEQNQLKSGVEAILFALGEPVAQDRLAEALNVFPHQIEEVCLDLARDRIRIKMRSPGISPLPFTLYMICGTRNF